MIGDATGLALDKMRRFYELFPYPNRSWFVEPQLLGSCLAHAGFCKLLGERALCTQKVWHALRTTKSIAQVSQALDQDTEQLMEAKFPPSKRICLVGCGTDEPLLFRKLHPQNEIVGLDLSAKALTKARGKLRLLRLKSLVGFPVVMGRTHLLQGDATAILEKGELGGFDHIQCFGVLHHQPNPEDMFAAMVKSLLPGGTIRLMIYSHKGRRLERRIQSRYAALWQEAVGENDGRGASCENHSGNKNGKNKSSTSGQAAWTKLKFEYLALRFWQFYNLALNSGSTSYRFRYLGFNGASVADALLHPSDPGLPPENLMHWAKLAKLRLVFCEARVDSDGWVAGFADAPQVWDRICEADAKDGLLSNIVAVFKKDDA